VDQTQREFLVEIEELVEHIFADLDKLRACPSEAGSRHEERELIDQIFRRVHSVKGLAASSGLEVVSHIAHEFENVIDAVRGRRILLGKDLLDACEMATEALGESLSLAAAGIVEPSRRALFDRLQAAASGKTRTLSGNTEAVLEKIPFEIWQTLNESEKHRLVSAVEEGNPLFIVLTSFDLANFDEQFFRLKEKLVECGDVISTSPTVDDERPEKINFRVLYASNADLPTIQAAVVDFSDVALEEIASSRSRMGSAVATETSTISSSVASISSLSNFVRTDLEKLDRLISSTHELLRSTSDALGFAISQKEISTQAREELRNLNEHIRNSFIGLEDELINLRMVSLGPTLQRAARAGRAAARAAEKEVFFEIVGTDLRLDKVLADAIADSLVHLVRNAVDHGVESAEERVLASKEKRGSVRIEAVSEGSQTRVRVTDDGRGIEPRVIAEAATRLGIVESDYTLDIERSLRLIFRPGFTTLASVSDVSGRGVGLDVVETAVEQVGGELRVSSKPMEGTTFEIRLPVTFGLLAATMVVSAGKHYCIPAWQTVAVDAIDASDAEKLLKGEMRSGADQLELFSMRELLGQSLEDQETDSSQQQLKVITCQVSGEPGGGSRNGLKRIGILVDAVEGTQEVLVRNLGRHAGRWYGVAGATELRDGTVALVLDLPRLLASSE
jgi:two-component system, chemotaxis family, sensor kinase CheA